MMKNSQWSVSLNFKYPLLNCKNNNIILDILLIKLFCMSINKPVYFGSLKQGYIGKQIKWKLNKNYIDRAMLADASKYYLYPCQAISNYNNTFYNWRKFPFASQ